MKKYGWILLLGFLGSQALEAQMSSDSLVQKRDRKETTLDFMFHYYDQDGTHSAVTGGVGTEKLSDYDSKIQIDIPLDSVSLLRLKGGVNVYTSASTDRIDALISSASSEDIQAQMYIDWEEESKPKKIRYGVGMGGATESDYLSGSVNGFIAWQSKDDSREWQVQTQLFFDRWQLFFPDELRGTPAVIVDTDRRNTYNLGIGLSQIIGPRLKVSLQSDLSFQQGLLSTPFHRVYFPGEEKARIERFPHTRFRLPLGGRLHYYWGDFVICRLFYRYYWDSFGIQSHTAQLGFAIKLGHAITLSPAFRFHHQLASRFFAPYNEHQSDALFYTSDYDLSSFDSQQWTLGLKYSPIYGIGRWQYGTARHLGIFKSWEVRVARYQRTDGLAAFAASMGFSFGFY